MDETTIHVLTSWRNAHEQAEHNTDLLLLDDTTFSPLCAALMDVCSRADKMLYDLPVDGKDFPKELTNHLMANKNKACLHCMLNSDISKNHPECTLKMKNFFDSREKLLMFIQIQYT